MLGKLRPGKGITPPSPVAGPEARPPGIPKPGEPLLGCACKHILTISGFPIFGAILSSSLSVKQNLKYLLYLLLGLNEVGSVKASFEMLASLLSARFLTVFSCPCIQHPCHGAWTTSYLCGSLPRAESFWFSGWSWQLGVGWAAR